jgi:hypothetical protein
MRCTRASGAPGRPADGDGATLVYGVELGRAGTVDALATAAIYSKLLKPSLSDI